MEQPQQTKIVVCRVIEWAVGPPSLQPAIVCDDEATAEKEMRKNGAQIQRINDTGKALLGIIGIRQIGMIMLELPYESATGIVLAKPGEFLPTGKR